MSNDWYSDIVGFHKRAGQMPADPEPHIVSDRTYKLRDNLIDEEVNTELRVAMLDEDLVEIADGIVDAIVVIIGTAIAYGIDIRPIWDEVHRTNMAKFNGGSISPDGKVLKPKEWQPPDIAGIIESQKCQ